MSTIQEIQGDDLRQLELELEGSPVHDHLAVFIRDPRNPQQYWFRKVGIKCGSVKVGMNEKLPYVDVVRYKMGNIDANPVPESRLLDAVQIASICERELIPPEAKKIQAVVGVARYKGNNQLTLDEIIPLVGLRYHRMRASYLS